MSASMDRFRRLADELREVRRGAGRSVEEEQPLLDALEDLVDEMDDDERSVANTEGWRGWPDLYDKRMMTGVEDIDPDDVRCADAPPRRYSEAA